jgi:two-component system sensor histidine kinase BarA
MPAKAIPLQRKKVTGRPRVLVVEDNKPNAELISLYIGKDCDVEIAYTGKLALKFAWQNAYDIVLMDINLAGEIDGILTAHEIKAMEKNREVPVIAVTGYSSFEEKEEILRQGLDDFLSKPFTREELSDLIEKWITR